MNENGEVCMTEWQAKRWMHRPDSHVSTVSHRSSRPP